MAYAAEWDTHNKIYRLFIRNLRRRESVPLATAITGSDIDHLGLPDDEDLRGQAPRVGKIEQAPHLFDVGAYGTDVRLRIGVRPSGWTDPKGGIDNLHRGHHRL